MTSLTNTHKISGTTSAGAAISITPNKLHVASAGMVGNTAGDWSTAKALYTASGTAMPVGIRVFGSNGKRYKLTGTAWGNDPTTDGGTNWTSEEAAAASGTYYGPSPPASPSIGEFWKSTSGAAAPYHGSCLYQYDTNGWNFVSGDAAILVAGSLTNVTSGTFIPLTEYADNNIGTVAGSTLTITIPGVYALQAKHNDDNNPSFSWAGKTSTDLIGVREELFVNGSGVKKWGDLRMGQPAASPFAVPFDDGGYSDAGQYLSAGTTLQMKVTAFNCTLDNISMTLMLRRVA